MARDVRKKPEYDGSRYRPGTLHMHRWMHNAALGSAIRERNFMRHLLIRDSLTEDAKHHIQMALDHLELAIRDIRTRRVELDGKTITQVYRYLGQGQYEKVKK